VKAALLAFGAFIAALSAAAGKTISAGQFQDTQT